MKHGVGQGMMKLRGPLSFSESRSGLEDITWTTSYLKTSI